MSAGSHCLPPVSLHSIFSGLNAVFTVARFFSDLNREWLADFAWTYSMYLEASAMLPQIYMFQKQAATEGGVVEVSVCMFKSCKMAESIAGCSL
jgi:ER lumen protein retaining receptor